MRQTGNARHMRVSMEPPTARAPCGGCKCFIFFLFLIGNEVSRVPTYTIIVSFRVVYAPPVMEATVFALSDAALG